MNSSLWSKRQPVEGGGFRLPGVPLTLYPTSDPNRVKFKMNDPAIKTCSGQYLYSSTKPSYTSPETLALLSRSSSKSIILHGFGPKKRPVATQPEQTSSSSSSAAAATPSNINAAAPPPTTTTTSAEGQAEAGGPVLKRARMDQNPSAADSTATAAAATPSNINAAAPPPPTTTTSAEGQAEAGGPVLKRARMDQNPSAADSTATGSRNN